MKRRHERGAVAVQAVTVAALLVAATLVMVQMTELVRLRHRVASAADLSALAASQASVAGREGCDAARAVARRNTATLVRCRMDYDVATVVTRGVSRSWWGHRWATQQTARALPDFYLE